MCVTFMRLCHCILCHFLTSHLCYFLTPPNTPLKARPGSIEEIDDEYIRKGVAEIFIAVKPLGNHRKVWLNSTRTSTDWAEFIKQVVAIIHKQRKSYW